MGKPKASPSVAGICTGIVDLGAPSRDICEMCGHVRRSAMSTRWRHPGYPGPVLVRLPSVQGAWRRTLSGCHRGREDARGAKRASRRGG